MPVLMILIGLVNKLEVAGNTNVFLTQEKREWLEGKHKLYLGYIGIPRKEGRDY